MGKLTDITIRSWIKADERFEARGDGEGLALAFREGFAVPIWRFRYRFAGKARVMTLGSYRHVSLADARRTTKELRARVSLGHDVAGEKQERKRQAVAKIEAQKNAVTVAQLADEYFKRNILGRWKHPNIVRSRIEKDIKPNIGGHMSRLIPFWIPHASMSGPCSLLSSAPIAGFVCDQKTARTYLSSGI